MKQLNVFILLHGGIFPSLSYKHRLFRDPHYILLNFEILMKQFIRISLTNSNETEKANLQLTVQE